MPVIIEKKLCDKKISQPQSLCNAEPCVYQSFAVRNSSVSCLDLLFDLSNTKMKANNWFKFARYDESYTVLFADPSRYKLIA